MAITMIKNPLDEQNSKPLLVGVGAGSGVALGAGVGESVGIGVGLLMLVLVMVAVGTIGCVPVADSKLSRMRASAEVVSSPKKRKFGVW